MWKFKTCRNLRTVSSLEKKLISMEKKFDSISVDHGVAVYEYDHYEIEPGRYERGIWKDDSLTVFVKDFAHNHKVIPYMTVTDDSLRKPNGERDEYIEFVDCYVDSKFPSILCMREFTYRG